MTVTTSLECPLSPLQAFTYSPSGDLLTTHAYTNGTDYTTETYAYDLLGNRISPTDAHGNTIHRTYDPFGRILSEYGATYPVRYTYDTQSRRTSLSTTRDGTTWDTTTWAYDPYTGNCLSKIYADGSTITYTYTPDNLPLRTTYPSGKWKENVYDAQRRLCGVVYSSRNMDYELQLDAYGRTTYSSNGVAQTVYVLNDVGGVTNEIRTADNAIDRITRTFDGGDRLTRLAMPEQCYEQCLTYSTNGLLSTISNSDAVVTCDYSDDLRDIGYAIAFVNGDTFSRTVVRDPFRRDLILSVTNTCGALSYGTAYTYDALSRPISRDADTFGYNGRNEVSEATIAGNTETHEYDSIGNATLASFNFITNTYTANNVNQYTSILCDVASLREPTYDLDGNMTFDSILTYAYDAENRLVSVSSNGITVVSNEYDHNGRRVRKTTPVAVTTFLYDGWNLIYEHEVVGSVTNETFYYWGKDISGTLQGAGGVGGLLYQKRNGIIHVPHYDAYGNILLYTDKAGNVVASYTYDSFGRIISRFGEMADVFRHRFSTKYFDIETGLYYYGYRFYNPILMRWLNRDPLGEDGGINIYLFCRNNAIARLDPWGLIDASIGVTYTYPTSGKFAEALNDFLNGGPSRHYWYAYPDSAATRLLSHPNVYPVWRKFLDARCGTTRVITGEIMYKAPGWQFFKDVWTTFGVYEVDGHINIANNYARDLGYEVLGSFTGHYTISLDCAKCQKSLVMRIYNTFTMASLTRIPFFNFSLISGSLLNPVYQTFAYDMVKPVGWTGLEIRSR